jgi:geranylgeranyl diphosphate synthase type II
MSAFEKYLAKKSAEVDLALKKYLPKGKSTLVKAMRYSMFAGGKRFRPVLMLAVAESLGKPTSLVLPAACAIEMIHTFTLIHDDLPAMDDAELRRGKPTNHMVFGEDIAVLAGDGLLNEAFLVLAKNLPAKLSSQVTIYFANALGIDGVVEGQVRDLEAEGKSLTIKELAQIHERKTGALLEGAMAAAALLSSASKKQTKSLLEYSKAMGLVFQIKDDLLDATATAEELGKNPSDEKLSKQTYVKILGVEGAKKACDLELAKAKKALKTINLEKSVLAELVDYAANRGK